ncbi:DNA modification methylase [Nitratireductor aquibiodomus]|uniref:Methyltransferase n=1 Tax=Nitratireductor aquibiodomus TaxID=204799 RepID=A0A1H4KF64_9HYPH|nr:DNA methyltransferase [Nitratireductor aquibiodomus]SEB56708.1 DNA modification methylase [Nitratireductor aquibiodomus]
MPVISSIIDQRAGSLKENIHNARTHSKKQIKQIAQSIERFGFLSPILADENGIVIAGHGRLAAAKVLQLDVVPTIKVSGLSDVEKRQLLLADNKIAANAGWDRERLAVELSEILVEGGDIELTGFEVAEVDEILLDHETGPSTPEDELPENNSGSTTSRLGDLWILGRHRLLCGDALNARDLDVLCGDARADMVFTDPPYNLAITDIVGRGQTKHREFEMASGEMSNDEFCDFLRESLKQMVARSCNGAIHFICMDWRHVDLLVQECRKQYGSLLNIAVWVKNNGGQGSLYRSQHELIVVARVGETPHRNNVQLGKHGRNRTNVWQFAGVNSFRKGRLEELAFHPTVKPVALIAEAIKDCTQRGDHVLDIFGGSGSTLIACEKVGRRALLIEIDPAYVDTTIRRWEKFTGRDAVHLASGRTFNEIRESGSPNSIGSPGENH